MTIQIDDLGPVDWFVVEVPGSKIHGEIAPALDDLVERGIIRVLDLLILKRDTDGALETFELADLDESEIGQLRAYEAELATLLGEDDVAAVAETVEPGSTAACIVYETRGVPERRTRCWPAVIGGCPPVRHDRRRVAAVGSAPSARRDAAEALRSSAPALALVRRRGAARRVPAVIRDERPSAGPARPVPGTVCPDPVAG